MQHDIALHVSDGQLQLWVDARLVATSAFDGGFADLGRHDLTFGNPWGKTNFDGDLGAFSINLNGTGPAPSPLGQMQGLMDMTPLLAFSDDTASVSPDGTLPAYQDQLFDGVFHDQETGALDIFSRFLSFEADPPLI